MIAILEAGSGHLAVARAFERLGAPHRLARLPADLAAAEAIVLSDAGPLERLMAALDRQQLRPALAAALASDCPLLAVGTGLHALYEGSATAPGVAGLAYLSGRVRPFTGARTTHVGWAPVQCLQPSRLLAGLGSEPWFSFQHSQFAAEDARTTYVAFHDVPFTAVLERANVCGVQFHPEKSGPAGMALLTNFMYLRRGAPVASRNRGAAPGRAAARVLARLNWIAAPEAPPPEPPAPAGQSLAADGLILFNAAGAAAVEPALVAAVAAAAANALVPLTIGGGVRTRAQADALLAAGADKILVNTAVVVRPALLEDLARAYGPAMVAIAIDARRREGGWEVYTHGGRNPTGLDAKSWAGEVEQRGAGEILLASLDADAAGFDCELTAAVSRSAAVPVLAFAAGARPEDCVAVLSRGQADGVVYTGDVAELKLALQAAGLLVRPVR